MYPSNIKEKRLEAGLTQSQAAQVVYVHLRTWIRWETGSVPMPRGLWELFVLRTEKNEVSEQ